VKPKNTFHPAPENLAGSSGQRETPMQRLTKCALFVLIAFAFVGIAWGDPPALKTQNVILVMTDGLRWQEVFRGADEKLMNKEHGGVKNLEKP